MTAESGRTGWSRPVDLKAALAGTPPPAPRVGRWTDSIDGKLIHRALFYPNEVHSVFGDPEAMKSWLLLMSSAQEVKLGNHVIFVDMEANDRSVVDRLRLLGATARDLKKHFHYLRPDGPISLDDQTQFKKMVEKWKPSLVVLDGVTEAFAIHGFSINSAEDAAHWFRSFARQFQVRPTEDYDGPAIVELDHVVKSQESRGGWAIGSIHKKAGIKGAAYQVVSAAPFGKGKHGRSRLFLEKDSPGGIEWVASGTSRRRLVGELHCDSTGDGIDAWIESADESVADVVAREQVAPSQAPEFQKFMRDAWAYVEAHPGVSGKVIRSQIAGVADKKKQDAIAVLEADGHLVNEGSAASAKWFVGTEFRLLKSVEEPGRP